MVGVNCRPAEIEKARTETREETGERRGSARLSLSRLPHSFAPSPPSESQEQASRQTIHRPKRGAKGYVQRVSSGKRFLLCGRPAKLTGMTLEGGSSCTERVLI